MDVIFTDFIDNGLVSFCNLISMQLKTGICSVSCINRITGEIYPHRLTRYFINFLITNVALKLAISVVSKKRNY
jgi:hypothetical protein